MGQPNSAFPWDQFDSEAYLASNYMSPREEDFWLAGALGLFYRALPADLAVVDVGTGPSLITLLAALGRARGVTAWEYSASNIAWLRSTINTSLFLPEPWSAFWKQMATTAPDPYDLIDPTHGLRSRVDLVQRSIFDLPRRSWDVATMFFVAESVTADYTEFRIACSSFAQAVKPGGSLAAAFMANSAGYFAGSTRFPAVSVGIGDIAEAFGEHVQSINIQRVPSTGPPLRSGYEGMIFMSAVVRQDTEEEAEWENGPNLNT